MKTACYNVSVSRNSAEPAPRWPSHCIIRARKIFSVPVAEFFGPSPGALFLVAFSFNLVAIVRQDSKLKAQRKKKDPIFEASFCTHPKTNIINEMIASSFFCNQNRWKTKKKMNLMERSCAQFIFMKLGEEGAWACCAPTALYLVQRYLVSFVRGTCVLRFCCRFRRQESGFRLCYV